MTGLNRDVTSCERRRPALCLFAAMTVAVSLTACGGDRPDVKDLLDFIEQAERPLLR